MDQPAGPVVVPLAGSVSTLAGSPGESGAVDGVGSDARFSNPAGVALDGSGTIYVADFANNTIRKVTPAGSVSTLAGAPGEAGSVDGTGAAARFNAPNALAVDRWGNVYVADSFNDTIRKVTPDGTVSTLAGSPGEAGSVDGTGPDARFSFPGGIAVDATGNVYVVADFANNTVRRITPDGVVTTVAGAAGEAGSADGPGADARFSGPLGVAADGRGTVYVADSANNTIRMVAPDGTVSTLAGAPGQAGSADGPGPDARFDNPYGLAVNGAGTALYVSDTLNHTVRKIT